MTVDGDITPTIRSWLREDQHESAARVLDDVLARLDTTSQRRAWWPALGLPQGRPIARWAIPVATVLIVAVVAVDLLSFREGVRGGLPGVSPSPATTPSPSPKATPRVTPEPTPPNVRLAEPLDIGSHSVTFDGVRLSFDLTTGNPQGDGWGKFFDLYISKSVVEGQTAEAMLLVTTFPDGIVAHPCGVLRSLPAGASVSDLALAVSKAPGTTLLSKPADVTIGGRAAIHVAVSVRQKIGCEPGFFYAWLDSPGGPWWPSSSVGDTIHVWIVDVDGRRVFLATETHASIEPADAAAIRAVEQEVQQIVRSIRFE